MAPTPEEHASSAPTLLPLKSIGEPVLEDDDIVISGISGLYPEARNIKEFSDILYNKKNPITESSLRWIFEHPELPQYLGRAPDLDSFDAQFFAVNYRLGGHMDPMSRKLLEHTYQAIYDAGLSPAHLSGKKVAVFTGSSFSDSETACFTSESKTGLAILGSSKTMFANRISYWLNIRGPSVSVDEADCSSTVALEQAFSAIRRGECEAAIVGGANLCLQPHAIIHHGRRNKVTREKKIKSYSENSDGYVLADSINVLFLQKAKDALRIYAQLMHVKNEYVHVINDKTGPKYGYQLCCEKTAKFIKDFYGEVQVPPQAIEYVEGYGVAAPEVDKSELETIAQVYCKDRTHTLLVGSVTSNIGLTGAASGIAGITKVLLGYYKGELAANLNCDQPMNNVPAIRDGRIRIVNEHQPFGRTYAAINGMSYTGVNSHVLLCGHYKHKDLSRYKTSMPYLVTLSGRQQSNVENIFDNLKSRHIDPEEISLLHNIHSKNISGHLGRGFIILDNDADKKTVSVTEKHVYYNHTKRPLWFVYSGMGSQWAGMGAQLMQIPIFASAIERCRQVLAPKGLDIVDIITRSDKTIFDNILHSFVGIAAIQIGLTDILRALGLVPDGIIGHSVGELGCAYADGCLTAEEMILAAYSRGLVSLETPLIRGSMAAVGLGYNQVSAICPPGIDVACHNSSVSSTISGPADIMTDFVAQLTAEGVFAKEVPCSNIAYHSRYISVAGPKLLKYLKEVIKDPKPRSERWLSTSVPQDKWNEPLAKYCSAEYHTNNLLNPVLFEETIKLIPRNAVLVEIAPHGLLQAILKRSMPMECRSIPLTRRKDRENVIHLLRAIGDIYLEGFALNTQALYPKVQFPVSTETPMLSHLVDWMHSEKWKVASMNMQNKKYSSECTFKISVHDKEHGYLKDHVIRNKMCYPFAASLVAVWDMFAMYSGLSKRDVSVIFEDIHFYAQPLLFYQKALNLYVSLRKATGRFEIRTEHTRVATGRITQNVLEPSNILTFEDCYGENNNTNLTSDDIYRLLNDRGYNYTGDFRSIEWANASLTKAALVWNDNWITFIDGILQLNMLRQQYNDVSLLTYIRKISIDVREHSNNHVHQLNGKSVLQADVEDYLDYTRCGGVLVCNLQYCDLPKISHGTQIFSNWSSATENMLKMNPNKTDVANVVTLQIAEIGKLESMHWLQAPFIPRSNVTVTVHFAGLSLYDLRKAIGTISNENSYGMDYSGITKSGERVMGLLRSGAVSSCVDAHPELVWPVPEHWSLEDAATVPFAYAYAFYALVIKGHIEPGMNILIHEGTDALGQAAIAIALAYKCQVFATVSDTYSKVLLQKRFPQLQDEYIGSSRDISFSDSVLLATRGTGCDIIIGCVKGELKNVSLKCCRASGVLIDTIQILDREEYEYGMFYMTKGRSYLTVDFTSIFTNDARLDMKILHKLVCDGIAAGFVVPLSRVTYKPLEVEKAFKLLEKRNIGRVLICMCENMIPVQHRVICDPDQCQIMFWNNENLGIRIAEKLIYHGAKHLIIISNELTAYQSFKIRSWKNLEVKIEVFCEKVTQDLLKTNVLHDAFNLGTVQGIYVILTTDNSKEVMAEYASVLDQLDSLSRSLCHQLKNFVVMTPMKALGEKVCLSRVKSGFSATLLDISNIKNEKEIEDFDVMNAIESARCNNTVMFAAKTKQVQQTNPQSLSDQVIALAGIRIPQHADPDVTLQELGIAHEKRALVCAFLNVTYNLSLAENDVSLLTLQDINNLEQSVTEILPLNDSGLSTFISESKFNDLLATVDTILLPTLANKVASVENDFDITGNYLCIVPGIEGYHERFRTLCERLKLPAVVLQPGYDHPHETVKETAERYAEVLTKKTKMPSSFYILGYESGIFVAMELAAILEDQGLTGTVFYLGCAPSEFQTEVQEQLKEFETEEKLQNALVRHLCKLILGQDHDELDDELQNATSWTQIESIYIRYLTGRMLNSTQFASGLLKTTLARLLQAQRNIVTVRRLRSKVVVLRAATERELPHDTILQQLSQQPVSVHQLNFPLSCVSRDMESSAIINQYLDIAILKAFDNMNLCETYI